MVESSLSSSSSLIPGLADDVAELCLSRIPRSSFRIISQVCWRWRRFLGSERYAAVRKLTGTVEELMCVLDSDIYWEVFDGSGNKLGCIPPVLGPLKRGYVLAMLLDGGKIVFIGGALWVVHTALAFVVPSHSPSNPNSSLLYKSSFIDIYDPKTETWEELDSGKSTSANSHTVVRNKVYFLDCSDSRMGVFDPENNSWSSVFVPPFGGRYLRCILGQLNNKIILFSRGCEGIWWGDFDKEDAAEWRASPIKLSGYDVKSVLINF